MKKLLSISVLGLSTLLFGCANTPERSLKIVSNDAEEIALDPKKFSAPSRFLYAVTGVEPEVNKNNLDKFYYDTDPNTLQTAAQLSTLAGALASNLNFLNAAANLIALEGSKNTYSDYIGTTMLITVKKFDRNQNWRVQNEELIALNHKTIKESLGDSVEIKHSGVEYYSIMHYDIKEKGNKHCLDESEYGQDKFFPRNLCYSNTYYVSKIYFNNNNDIPFAPKGDVILSRTSLAPGFPIEKLEFNKNEGGAEQYLYVSPIKLNPAYGLFTKKNLDDVTDWYKKERLSVNPYLKRLSDGKIMYFNSKITAKQKDEFSTYRVFDLKNKK